MTQQFSSYFTLNILEVTALSLFLLFFLTQIFFYFYYYRKPLSYIKKTDSLGTEACASQPKVSVIISSENEAKHLSENLPAILEQDYPDFEVVVVNNGSTDESDELLQSLKLRYPHLYHTYLPYSNDKVFGRRKLAITLGIKAAKGDILLFTEPYSKPASNKWIGLMVKKMSEGKDVVLGYSYYKKTDQFFNRIARFDNHLLSMQYLAQALRSKPFTGVYRNLAFKKHLFFDNKGFASYLNIENGEDLFINQIVSRSNTAVALEPESFVETYINNYSLWKQIKKSYSLAKSYFKSKAVALFAFESFSRYMFYLLLIAMIVSSILTKNWVLLAIVLCLFLFRLIMQLVIINKGAKYFCSGKFYFSLIMHDLLQPAYNFAFKTRHKKLKVR